MSEELPERVGCFVVEGVLGRGGMGVVYRALDPRLNRRVAVKVLSPAVRGDAHRTARLMREARAAAAVAHPNIATVYEVGVDERGNVYLALELVEGRSLRELLRDGPLPLHRFLPLACEMASALARAHRAGLIHRDLKPENVMVDPDGHAKILDFGLAKRTAPEGPGESILTQEGELLGTPGYMAPEQLRGEADARADVFALGVTCFEMLAGQRPFGGDTPLAAMLAVEEPPRVLPAGVAPELEGLIASMLARDPGDRPADGGAVLEALSAAGRGASPRVPASSKPAAATSVAYANTLASPSGPAVAASTGIRRAGLVLAGATGALLVAAMAAVVLQSALSDPESTPASAVARRAPVFRPLRAGRDASLTGWPAGTPVRAVLAAGPGAVVVLRARDVVQISRTSGAESVIARDVNGIVGVDGERVLVRVGNDEAPGDLAWVERGRLGSPIARDVLAATLGTQGIAVLGPEGIRVVDRGGAPMGELLSRRAQAGTLVWFPTRPCVAAVIWFGQQSSLLIACSDRTTRVLEEDRRLFSATGRAGVLAPRDDRLLFVRSAGVGEAAATLFELPLDGNDPTGPARPIHEWTAASASDLSLDGDRMLYVRSASRRDLYTVDLEAPRPVARAVVTHDAADLLGSVSRRGELLFHSRRGPSVDLYRTSADGGAEVAIVNTPEWDEEAPVAHRDSVVYLRRPVPRDGNARPWSLIRRDADGSETTLREGGPAAESFASLPRLACATAADACVLAAPHRGQTVVSTFDPMRPGATRLLYRWTRAEALRRPAVSPDGSHVVLVPNAGNTALRIAVATGAVTEWPVLADPSTRLQYAAISPRGNRLAVTTLANDGYGVAWLDDRGHLEPILASEYTWWADPFFTPNGRSLALTGMTYDDDAWSLELTLE